jgi:hypothetical protein
MFLPSMKPQAFLVPVGLRFLSEREMDRNAKAMIFLAFLSVS